jgi:hypothetical protein
MMLWLYMCTLHEKRGFASTTVHYSMQLTDPSVTVLQSVQTLFKQKESHSKKKKAWYYSNKKKGMGVGVHASKI